MSPFAVLLLRTATAKRLEVEDLQILLQMSACMLLLQGTSDHSQSGSQPNPPVPQPTEAVHQGNAGSAWQVMRAVVPAHAGASGQGAEEHRHGHRVQHWCAKPCSLAGQARSCRLQV